MSTQSSPDRHKQINKLMSELSAGEDWEQYETRVECNSPSP